MAKNTKTPPLDKPNRRTIEALLRDLTQRFGGRKINPRLTALDRKLDARRAELDKLRDRFQKTPRYVRLDREIDRLHREYNRLYEAQKEAAQEIRRRYQANGITPAVVKALNELLDGKLPKAKRKT